MLLFDKLRTLRRVRFLNREVRKLRQAVEAQTGMLERQGLALERIAAALEVATRVDLAQVEQQAEAGAVTVPPLEIEVEDFSPAEARQQEALGQLFWREHGREAEPEELERYMEQYRHLM